MTDLQREQAKSSIIGKRFRWRAQVKEVTTSGRVQLDADDADVVYFWTYVDGFFQTDLMNMNKGQTIEFEATVYKTGTGLLGIGFAVYMDDPVLIR